MAAFAAGAWAQASIELPVGGWRYGASGSAGFIQEVRYPASSVGASGHADAALIRGRIAGAPKDRRPATLVVNGVAMPLSLDETGAFARPYAFAARSNAIEVRSPDGKSRRRVQFYEGNVHRPQARLRVVLSWDTDGTDLDLHVVAPDGVHTYYGNRVGANGGALDVDVTTGYGPEIYANPTPPRGVWHVFVNYFGAGEDRGILTIAQLAVVMAEGTPQETVRTFRVPMRNPGELTLVGAFALK
jgi:uncharacterized protein YfaP (DUF2135 family)